MPSFRATRSHPRARAGSMGWVARLAICPLGSPSPAQSMERSPWGQPGRSSGLRTSYSLPACAPGPRANVWVLDMDCAHWSQTLRGLLVTAASDSSHPTLCSSPSQATGVLASVLCGLLS